MTYKAEIDGIKEALTLWAYLETKDMDERTTPEEIKQRRKYHLKVFNDFNEITKNLWIGQTDVAPEWLNYGTSASESKGGEEPKRANLEGVNAEKGRK